MIYRENGRIVEKSARERVANAIGCSLCSTAEPGFTVTVQGEESGRIEEGRLGVEFVHHFEPKFCPQCGRNLRIDSMLDELEALVETCERNAKFAFKETGAMNQSWVRKASALSWLLRTACELYEHNETATKGE